LSDFDALVPLLESLANDDPGTVEYRWYGGPTPTARCLYERYRDSDATIEHIEAFGQEPTKHWAEMIKLTSVIMLGPASDQLTANLAPFFNGSIPDTTAVWYRTSDELRPDQVRGVTTT
jgi:hypothetical protein